MVRICYILNEEYKGSGYKYAGKHIWRWVAQCTGKVLNWYSGGAWVKSLPNTDYPDRSFHCLPQSLKENVKIIPKFNLWPLPSRSFPLHLSSYHSVLCSLATDCCNNQQRNRYISCSFKGCYSSVELLWKECQDIIAGTKMNCTLPHVLWDWRGAQSKQKLLLLSWWNRCMSWPLCKWLLSGFYSF
jgi:hypothetical protein